MNLVSAKWLLVMTMTLLLGGCFDKELTTQLSFKTSYQGIALNCNTFFSQENEQWSYNQLQFFISNVSVKKKDGSWYSWTMTETPYQTSNVGLLGEVCGENNKTENGSGNANWQLNFSSDEDLSQVSEIRFTLGIPFEFNHLNPLTQASPLNDSSMFWVWQSGHKFLRLEMENKTDDWIFHLGSTGCKAPSAMRAPKVPCINSNRVTFELSINQGAEVKNSITFDLAKLFNGLKLRGDNSCQSDTDNPTCQQLFNNLGLVNNSLANNVLDKNSLTKMSLNTGVFSNE